MQFKTVDKLIQFMEQFLSGQVKTELFCDEFERIYNFELSHEQIPGSLHKSLEKIFDIVTWYSPFEEERRKIPNYKDEKDVQEVVNKNLDIIRAEVMKS